MLWGKWPGSQRGSPGGARPILKRQREDECEVSSRSIYSPRLRGEAVGQASVWDLRGLGLKCQAAICWKDDFESVLKHSWPQWLWL